MLCMSDDDRCFMCILSDTDIFMSDIAMCFELIRFKFAILFGDKSVNELQIKSPTMLCALN